MSLENFIGSTPKVYANSTDVPLCVPGASRRSIPLTRLCVDRTIAPPAPSASNLFALRFISPGRPALPVPIKPAALALPAGQSTAGRTSVKFCSGSWHFLAQLQPACVPTWNPELVVILESARSRTLERIKGPRTAENPPRCNRTRQRPGPDNDHTIWSFSGSEISGPDNNHVGLDNNPT